MHTPTVLTIAGFDPYGGAGIQADIKTVHALGGYALSATTALTAQNSQGVGMVEAVSSKVLYEQLARLLDDIRPDAVKIGMLANAELIGVVVDALKRYELGKIVLDPVLVSSSGRRLLEEDAVDILVQRLFPLCTVITPNIPEINMLLESSYKGLKTETLHMANAFFKLGADSVLIKGGHSMEEEAVDCLVDPSGIHCFSSPRVETTHTHGTGCVLSSAIATHLAHKQSLKESVEGAKAFLYDKLLHAESLHLPYRNEKREGKEPIF